MHNKRAVCQFFKEKIWHACDVLAVYAQPRVISRGYYIDTRGSCLGLFVFYPSHSHTPNHTHTHIHTLFTYSARCGVFNTTTRPPENYHKFSTFSFSFPVLGFVFLFFSDFVSATFICGCWWRGGLVWDLPRLTVSTQQVLRFTQDTYACDSCLSYLCPSISQRGQRRKWMDEWLMNLFRDKSAYILWWCATIVQDLREKDTLHCTRIKKEGYAGHTYTYTHCLRSR